MDEYITRMEHNEFARRIEMEDNRQNKRIDLLEESVRQNASLVTSVEKLAINMKNMLQEQKDQGARLKKLENEPAERWNSAKKTAFTTIVSVIAGALATGVIVMIAQYIIL